MDLMRFQLRLIIPLLLVALSLAQGAYVFIDQTRQAKEEIESAALRDFQVMLSPLQGTLEFLLRNGFEEQIQERISALGSDPYLRLAVLLDDSDKIIASQRLTDRQSSFRDIVKSYTTSDGIEKILERLQVARQVLKGDVWIGPTGDNVYGLYPITLGSRQGELRENRIGAIVLKRDLVLLKERAISQEKGEVFEVIIYITAVAVLIGFVLNALIMPKVHRLVASTEAFAAGDYRTRTGLAGKDELSRIGNAFDVMAQRVAETKHREEKQRERIQLLLDSTAEAIFGLGVDGRCTFVNTSCLEMLGYDDEHELLNKKILDLMACNQQQREDSSQQWCLEGVLKRGEPIHINDTMFHRKSGSAFPAEYWAHPIRERGQVVGAVVTFIDITERKQIEQMKDEFVSVVSHELRTPLTAITGVLGLMQSGVVEDLSERSRNLIDMASKNSTRLLHLINDILDMEKITAGKMHVNMVPISVRDLIAQSVDVNTSYAEQYNVSFRQHNDDIDALVLGDYDQLTQVLTNLLSNAAKFSHPGEEVEIRVSERNGRVRISVIDHGAGIPDEFRSRIFQKFTQADATDTRQKGGTGLGLSICKAIVEAHQGVIDFDSEFGKGTTLYFELPRYQQHSGEKEGVEAA